jgi:predicted GNAT superfamily acetyltransferase
MTGEPEIRTVEAPDDMAAIVTVFQQVWGTTTPIVNVELLRAMAHSGGYVAGVY